MTLAGGVMYTYDNNGNQTAVGADTFAWDAEDRPVTTVIGGVAGTYAYNGDGLRTTRTIGGAAVSYVWDQNASLPVILQDSDGNRYVYGLDLLTRVDGATEEWYLTDGLGSTTGLADAAGAITGTYVYDVFGAVRAQSGATTEWSYTGEQVDPMAIAGAYAARVSGSSASTSKNGRASRSYRRARAATTRGLNWLPAQATISATAAAMGRPLR